MKTRAPYPPSAPQAGMSLLVLIGVLAVIAIFAVVLFRAWIREIDHEVARDEAATLQRFSTALERTVLRNTYIPNHQDWDDIVAAEVGKDVARVYINPRKQTRRYLIDTSGWVQIGVLPYTQGIAGSTNRPTNVRMMIVSTIGDPLPAGVQSGYPVTTEFAALWNCPPGVVPTTGDWAGWNGRAEDVRVERITLDFAFVELRLFNGQGSTDVGLYFIGPNAPDPADRLAAPPQREVNPPRYVLRGTKIWLYDSAGNLDSRQILNKNSTYYYENGMWKSSAVGADLPGGLDLARVAAGFLSATSNTNAMYGAAQQGIILGQFINFMTNYINWAKVGFPEGDRAGLITMQQNMLLSCQELFIKLGAKDNFPINEGACTTTTP